MGLVRHGDGALPRFERPFFVTLTVLGTRGGCIEPEAALCIRGSAGLPLRAEAVASETAAPETSAPLGSFTTPDSGCAAAPGAGGAGREQNHLGLPRLASPKWS